MGPPKQRRTFTSTRKFFSLVAILCDSGCRANDVEMIVRCVNHTRSYYTSQCSSGRSRLAPQVFSTAGPFRQSPAGRARRETKGSKPSPRPTGQRASAATRTHSNANPDFPPKSLLWILWPASRGPAEPVLRIVWRWGEGVCGASLSAATLR
jgi:hypothetical protein